jgi:hypothetical protein
MFDFIDEELTQRANILLARMALLMDGESAGMGSGVSTNPPTSRIPTIGDSLLLRYQTMLSLVQPYELRKLRMILLKGEEELELAKAGNRHVALVESRSNKRERIVKMYRGWYPVEVAVAENCSEGMVRKLRSEANVSQLKGEAQ